MNLSFSRNRVISSLFAVILFSTPIGCNANNVRSPSRFPSVNTMIKELNDYSSTNETFKVISQDPLHIQLSPQIVSGEHPSIIMDEVDRSLVYGIYRAFIHTSVEEIIVTSLPKEKNIFSVEEKDFTEYKKTIHKSRKDALDLVKKYLRVNSFADLVTEVEVEGIENNFFSPDEWTKDFERLYYNDKGSPGLTQFVTELSK